MVYIVLVLKHVHTYHQYQLEVKQLVVLHCLWHIISNIIRANSVSCLGCQSCMNATINNTTKIYGKGAYSRYNAIVYSNETKNVSVTMAGYYSGYNTMFYCNGL